MPEIPGFGGAPAPDSIMLDVKSGAVELGVTMNGSGDPFTLERSTLVAKKEPGDLLPYGQVLRGILDGDPLLSVRADMAEECWRIFEPVLPRLAEGRGSPGGVSRPVRGDRRAGSSAHRAGPRSGRG